MANIGLRTFLYAPLGDDEKYTEEPDRLAGAISYDENIETNEAELYYDDELGEYDYSFVRGTLTLGIDNDDEVIFAPLLGNKVEEVTFDEAELKVVQDVASDQPVPVGFGFIERKRVGGADKFRVKFYKKVTFRPIKNSGQTKGRNMEFSTPTVEGVIQTLSDGSWRTRATLDDLETAVAFLESLFVQSVPEEGGGQEGGQT